MQNARLKHILASWQTWPLGLHSPPVLIKALNKGKTNQSYLLKTSQGKLKLRIHPNNKHLLGLNKRHEQAILDTISQSHIKEVTHLAPRLLFDNQHEHFALFEFIEGRTWTPKDIKQARNQNKLHTVIETIQKIEVDIPRIDYSKYIKRYLDILQKNKEVLPILEQQALSNFILELENFQDSGWNYTLCHHDLVTENILETENGLTLLDWEYAGLGHPEFDRRYIQSQLLSEKELKQSQHILDKLIYWTNNLWQLVIRL